MSREIAVVGAGIVGVSVAWHLRRRGHQVVLIDRRRPGQETSFGNAGMIQSASVRPYPFPRDLATLLRVAPNRQADIRYRVDAMVSSAAPLLGYWRNSSPERYARITPEYASIIGQSLEAHAQMVQASGAEQLVRRDGWLQAYRHGKPMDAAVAEAHEDGERYGIRFQVLDGEALARLEPKLLQPLAGAIHWLEPWTVESPGALVAAYADHYEAEGGEFMEAGVETIDRSGQRWHVRTSAGNVEADLVVLALGPWTEQWRRTVGLRLPLFVKRGYHMHYRHGESHALRHWMLDTEVGYVLAPMRDGMRLTTGAELAQLDAKAATGQLDVAERHARELVALGERAQEEPWRGARPCTSDMKPIIGSVPGKPDLWLACGHGHQGLTMGPATGRLLSQMIEGEPTAIDMAPFRVDRFQRG